jgi:hypothetical protein
LFSIVDPRAVEGASNHVVTDTREISYPATTDQNDGVLLEVVALTTDVCGDFFAIGKSHSSYLPQRGVWLLGSHGLHL